MSKSPAGYDVTPAVSPEVLFSGRLSQHVERWRPADAYRGAYLDTAEPLTLRLAEQHGAEIAGIVLVNPSIHTERIDRFALPLVQRFVASFPGISNDIAKPGQDEVAYDRLPLKAAYSLSQLWSVTKAGIASITQPVLLFRSLNDHVVEPSNAAYILANVSSTDVTEVALPDSYHVATLDHDAPLIVRDSIAFVRRLVG